MKIFQVFESYPLFYQPYIPPVLEKLSQKINSKVVAFKGQVESGDAAEVLPSYYKRTSYEKLHQQLNRNYKNLNYLEISAVKQKVDIIHIQHSYLFGKIKNLLIRNPEDRPKVVITLRGGDTYIKPWLQKKWRDFYKNYGKSVDAFVVMSEDQKQYLHRWHVPLDRIHVIPISFGEKFDVKPKSPNKQKLKLVSVFRMCWEKNIAGNLHFIKQLKASGITVQYDVYGDGPDLGQLYYLLDRLDLNDCVSVKGKVDNTILKQNLRAYDFILQLSHSESFGMSIVEAQAYGVPAIVSNADGLSESVLDGHSGFVLERDFSIQRETKKIIELWKSESDYIEMSQNAIDFSQSSFNIHMEILRLKKLYSSLIK